MIVGDSALVDEEIKLISGRYGVRVKSHVDEYIGWLARDFDVQNNSRKVAVHHKMHVEVRQARQDLAHVEDRRLWLQALLIDHVFQVTTA